MELSYYLTGALVLLFLTTFNYIIGVFLWPHRAVIVMSSRSHCDVIAVIVMSLHRHCDVIALYGVTEVRWIC